MNVDVNHLPRPERSGLYSSSAFDCDCDRRCAGRAKPQTLAESSRYSWNLPGHVAERDRCPTTGCGEQRGDDGARLRSAMPPRCNHRSSTSTTPCRQPLAIRQLEGTAAGAPMWPRRIAGSRIVAKTCGALRLLIGKTASPRSCGLNARTGAVLSLAGAVARSSTLRRF
jgi:hypothetical protein